jgi:hypothetical protein
MGIFWSQPVAPALQQTIVEEPQPDLPPLAASETTIEGSQRGLPRLPLPAPSETIDEEHQLEIPPPAYTPMSTCSSRQANPTIHVDEIDICEDCIPQWTWSRNQCRVWLYKILTKRCNHSDYDAYQTAHKFIGIAPTLYALTVESWCSMLEIHPGDAFGIYNLVQSFATESVGLSRLQFRR